MSVFTSRFRYSPLARSRRHRSRSSPRRRCLRDPFPLYSPPYRPKRSLVHPSHHPPHHPLIPLPLLFARQKILWSTRHMSGFPPAVIRMLRTLAPRTDGLLQCVSVPACGADEPVGEPVAPEADLVVDACTTVEAGAAKFDRAYLGGRQGERVQEEGCVGGKGEWGYLLGDVRGAGLLVCMCRVLGADMVGYLRVGGGEIQTRHIRVGCKSWRSRGLDWIRGGVGVGRWPCCSGGFTSHSAVRIWRSPVEWTLCTSVCGVRWEYRRR